MNKFIFCFLLFNSINAMEQTDKSTHEQSVVINVDHQQSNDNEFSCSIKSNCLKKNKAILAAGGSTIAFVVVLIIHLLNCRG